MNKWYFGIPTALLVAFFIYYLQFDKEYRAEQKEKVRLEEVAKEEKLAEERAARMRAVDEARKQIEQRRIEQAAAKAKREAEDALREEERLALERARSEQSRLRVELKDVGELVADEDRLLKAAAELKRQHEQEREHVLSYNDTARKNKDRFLGLIDKIEESEKQKAAAALAASAAKK